MDPDAAAEPAATEPEGAEGPVAAGGVAEAEPAPASVPLAKKPSRVNLEASGTITVADDDIAGEEEEAFDVGMRQNALDFQSNDSDGDQKLDFNEVRSHAKCTHKVASPSLGACPPPPFPCGRTPPAHRPRTHAVAGPLSLFCAPAVLLACT